jgi:hypothetical protein
MSKSTLTVKIIRILGRTGPEEVGAIFLVSLEQDQEKGQEREQQPGKDRAEDQLSS